eukprot:SM005389S17886  [mRNA]  locus=s5389:16:903:- [translate_table: standard]
MSYGRLGRTGACLVSLTMVTIAAQDGGRPSPGPAAAAAGPLVKARGSLLPAATAHLAAASPPSEDGALKDRFGAGAAAAADAKKLKGKRSKMKQDPSASPTQVSLSAAPTPMANGVGGGDRDDKDYRWLQRPSTAVYSDDGAAGAGEGAVRPRAALDMHGFRSGPVHGVHRDSLKTDPDGGSADRASVLASAGNDDLSAQRNSARPVGRDDSGGLSPPGGLAAMAKDKRGQRLGGGGFSNLAPLPAQRLSASP